MNIRHTYITRLLALAAVLMSVTCALAEGFTFNPQTDNVYVYRDEGAGYFEFTKTPWKCVLKSENGYCTAAVYYDRQGMAKATGGIGDNGEYTLRVFVKNGKNYDIYHCSAKHNEQGELEKTSVKSTYSTEGYKNFAARDKKLPDKLRHNTTTHVDKYGNWLFAGDPWKDGVIRELYYYDDGYDAAEDKVVDEVCQSAASVSNKAEVTQSIRSIPVLIVALIIKVCWLLLVIYLLLLLFKREWAYRPFNRYAGERVTPYGLFSKSQLLGIIPVALLFLPSLLLFGTVTMRETQSDVMEWAFVMLASLAASLAVCWLWVRKKSAEMGRKKAVATIAFSVWSILAVVAVIAIAVVAIWVAIVLVFLFAGLSTAIGGFIAGGAGSILQKGAGTGVHGKCCNNCKYCSGHTCTHPAMGNQGVDPMKDVCSYYIGA